MQIKTAAAKPSSERTDNLICSAEQFMRILHIKKEDYCNLAITIYSFSKTKILNSPGLQFPKRK